MRLAALAILLTAPPASLTLLIPDIFPPADGLIRAVMVVHRFVTLASGRIKSLGGSS
jgi:hypothetical protein